MVAERQEEAPVPQRDRWGRVLPGHCLNPGGRRTGTGLTARVREATRDGRDLVEFYVSVFKGIEPGAQRIQYRLQAAEWLSDRGWGRALQMAAVDVQTGPRVIQLDWGDGAALALSAGDDDVDVDVGDDGSARHYDEND